MADNTLNRAFDVDAPDQFRVTELTCIRSHEGVLHLAVVIDLFSRRVMGWSMQGRTYTDLPLQALLMAVWRRKPKAKVHVHSDQGSRFTSHAWQEVLEQHNLTTRMSRRGNCRDTAVVESFFNLLKRERIRRKTCKTREEARRDVFDDIVFFYNPQRKHVRNGRLSPIAFEQPQKLKLHGLQETRGYSPAVIAARHDDPASKVRAQAEKRRARQVAKAEEIPDLEQKVHAVRAQAMANAGLPVPERLSPKVTRLTAGGPFAPGEALPQPAKLTPKEKTDLFVALTAEGERTAGGCSR